eukprot:UN00241
MNVEVKRTIELIPPQMRKVVLWIAMNYTQKRI